ncbi:acyl carrier protein [Boseongicola aestuarii]|uniref:Acyl carrier protein n=1 Tax=Boseongicola aestuarii TaxID=1470561 RepID=A0A238IU79_9RHOB|nr:acyl carrier protein [Boseongicola aestuarii]SMX21929.1 acyl carrier protein [Boseongicola aestuarii]
MNKQDIETAVKAELNRIAPDIDADDIDRSENLRDEFDIDSMDFLNLVTALSKLLGLNIPEADYDQMESFDDLVGYLSKKAPA